MAQPDARRASAELLMHVLEEHRTLDEALSATRRFSELEGSDRGFARAMASAALRHLGRIDAGLAPFLTRPLETATPPLRALLRIGAAQMWVMETPAHAAVGETVNAAKHWKRASKGTGFLNAVLRKASKDRKAYDAAPVLGVWPGWLQDAMIESLGEDMARALAQAQMQEPEITLTAKTDPDALARAIGGKRTGPVSISVSDSHLEALPGYKGGEWWVQDVAATLPARLLEARPDERIFDLCAAPGGKTMQLAASGAKISAVDRSKKRLMRLQENLQRTELSKSVSVIEANIETWHPDRLAQKILLDAPCSALGTLRRHPEGAWIKTPESISRFPDIQARFLKAAHGLLEAGGTLVYCVCTPLKGEGIDVIEQAIDAGLFIRAPIKPLEIPGFETALTPAGDVLTLPERGPASDIFFISRLKKA